MNRHVPTETTPCSGHPSSTRARSVNVPPHSPSSRLPSPKNVGIVQNDAPACDRSVCLHDDISLALRSDDRAMGVTMQDLLMIAVERNATDLHITSGTYPQLRCRGGMVPLT